MCAHLFAKFFTSCDVDIQAVEAPTAVLGNKYGLDSMPEGRVL